ncbi:hypothetical protein V8E36_004598 [Tilletia maclaganii]
MRTGRVSSFTFACTTLAVTLSATTRTVSASVLPPPSFNTDAAFTERSGTTLPSMGPPSIVLTPPTPKPDIGILRLPITGMHTPPVPAVEGTTILPATTPNANLPTDADAEIPEESLHTPPGAGIRPLSPSTQASLKRPNYGQLSYRVHRQPSAQSDEYKPTPHPLRSAPSIRPQQRRQDSFYDSDADSTDAPSTERKDSTGRTHIARMRAFAAKAEYRNRRRQSQARVSEFATIDVVSSPVSTLNNDAEDDLASVQVGLGDGLGVAAIVSPENTEIDGSSENSSGSGSGSGSASGSKPKSKPSKGKSGSSSSSGSKSHGSKSTKVTWYSGKHLLDPACGGPSPNDHTLVAAVNRHSPFASCGDVLNIRSPTNGRSVTVRIVDWCDTCSSTEPWFDLTKGAFEKLGDLELGVIKGLQYERVRNTATASVKGRQRQRNHQRDVDAEVNADVPLDNSVDLHEQEERNFADDEATLSPRGRHEDLVNALLASDGVDVDDEPLSPSLLGGVLGILTGNADGSGKSANSKSTALIPAATPDVDEDGDADDEIDDCDEDDGGDD